MVRKQLNAIENSLAPIKLDELRLLPSETWQTESGFETGILLISGQIEVVLNGIKTQFKRKNPFDDNPIFIHLNYQQTCCITAFLETKLLVINVENKNLFPPKIYNEEIVDNVVTNPLFTPKDERIIRDIVNYEIEPLANIVIGEVVCSGGSWSSYPPHYHEQPEIYYYQYQHPSGFGVSVVGDEARVIQNGDLEIIPGNLIHPQVTAPGYPMYYCWIILNLPNNPWTERVYDKEHLHLLEEK